MTDLREVLADAVTLSERIAAIEDRDELEALLFSAVTRLAFLHDSSACDEIERLDLSRRGLARDLGKLVGR